MKKKSFFLTLGIALFLGLSSLMAQLPPPTRGDLVHAIPLKELPVTTEEIDLALQGLVPGLPSIFTEFLLPTNFDVMPYKILYWTADPLNPANLVVATGLLTLPVGYNCDAALLAYCHGTLFQDDLVPSNLQGAEALAGLVFATDGYVTVLPDYLGLGVNLPPGVPNPIYQGLPPYGIHPYLHAKSEATATIDLMRAARQFCASPMINQGLNGQVFVTGYSQGGHSAVATMREIEAHHPAEFNLVLTAAGSGSYDMPNTQYNFILNQPYFANPALLPYLILSYDGLYDNIFTSLNDVFKPPYKFTIPTLYNGTLDRDQINANLPAAWRDMFKPPFLRDLENNPYNPVRTGMAANTLLNFKPESQLRMYYCTDDELVAFQNSLVAWYYYKYIEGAVGNVMAIPLGHYQHEECAPYALLVGKLAINLRRTVSGCTFKTDLEQMDLTEWQQFLDEANLPELEVLLAEAGLSHLLDQPALELDARKVGIRLYPNPAVTQFTLEAPGALEVEYVKIMDISGRELQVIPWDATRRSLQMDCQQFSPGLYLVEVFAGRPYHLRLIIE